MNTSHAQTRRPPTALGRWALFGALAALALLGSACGGGGGGGGGAPTQVSFVSPAPFAVLVDGDLAVEVLFDGGAPKASTLELQLDGQPLAFQLVPGGLSANVFGLAPGPHTLVLAGVGGNGAALNADTAFEVYAGDGPGPDGGAPAFANLANRGALLFSQRGASGSQFFGERVLLVPDLDGDGSAELAVASPTLGTGRVRVLSGRTGALLWETLGIDAGERFGRGIAPHGDHDDDGVPDLLVGAPQTANSRGRVDVLSGADGTRLISHSGPVQTVAFEDFGSALAHVGDVDSDGVPDFAVGSPLADDNGTNSGALRILSGANGAILAERFGSGISAQLGVAMATLGDTNGDGTLDLIVGEWGDDEIGPSAGAAEIVSGSNGATLHRFLADAPQDHFGFSVGAAGDVDADGVPDAIVGGWENGQVAFWAGMARVFSGADGSVIHTFFGTAAEDKFGGAVAGAGDVDGDGHADLLVGALQELGSLGAVHLLSGATGALLARHTGFVANGQLGVWVSGGLDLDGDGAPDYAAGAWLEGGDNGAFLSGAAYAWSRRTVRLVPERARLSLGAGGTSGLCFDAGPDRAGEPYMLIGGVQAPGQPAPPMAPWPGGLIDPNQVTLAATAGGLLDGNGRACVQVVLPPATPALVGSQLLRLGMVGFAPDNDDTSQMLRILLVP
ncbi:MAG: hypothetical protein GC161_13520 [Planctomycetaceae bacterium]|nr:hypothetical protein [Planctomycetaceae bacterium]